MVFWFALISFLPTFLLTGHTALGYRLSFKRSISGGLSGVAMAFFGLDHGSLFFF